MSEIHKYPNLVKRALTAVVGVFAIIFLLYYGGLVGVQLFSFVISMAMLVEFCSLILNQEDAASKKITIIGVGVFVHLLFFMGNFYIGLLFIDPILILLLTFLILFSYFLFSAKQHSDEAMKTHFVEFAFSFVGLIYLVWVPLQLVVLREMQDGLHLVFLFLIVIWSTDIGAYFAGVKFGRTKLYEKISPKKSVEGLLGGVTLSVTLAFLYRNYFTLDWNSLVLFLTALSVALVSQVGDLCESWIKRVFDTKDSSSLLPGHGGFLDRFDGFIFGLPVMVCCAMILSLLVV